MKTTRGVMCLAAVVSAVLGMWGTIGEVQAGLITSVTYTDVRSYTAAQFSATPDCYIYNELFSISKFEPSLGHLQKVEITMTLVTGTWS